MTFLSRVFGAFMGYAGIMHFKKPKMFMRIVPPFLPFKKMLVIVSGIAEVMIGLLLVINKGSRMAGKMLTWLLLAVWPANVYMAIQNKPLKKGHKPMPLLLWIRVLLQWPMIQWARKIGEK
ncbi:DoxX family protein [Jeotgalibacillus proteolyticus]|uniref:DoxX family protein n=1 Tax=Jeotgalibacillus proteolyticus TaxID=2082395 RepID=UPI003CF6EE66